MLIGKVNGVTLRRVHGLAPAPVSMTAKEKNAMYKICHTEESSHRQRELEQGLLESLRTQPYDKLTLTDLCLRLEIPRKSFYRYFPTKDDCLLALMDHTLSDCNTVALSGWNGDSELTENHLLRFFSYWRQQEVFLDAVRDNGLSYLLLDRTTVIVDRMMENTKSRGFARDQVEYFVAHGLMTTVLRWHSHGYPQCAGELAEVFARLLHTPDVSICKLLL